jgi:hypothetical protein
MKNLYEVTAIKNRKIKTTKGYITAPDGYISYKCYQVATSENEAIEIVKSYYMPAGTQYDEIRASYFSAA